MTTYRSYHIEIEDGPVVDSDGDPVLDEGEPVCRFALRVLDDEGNEAPVWARDQVLAPAGERLAELRSEGETA
jgi:hypothetical protein